jgi:hypothetical protein
MTPLMSMMIAAANPGSTAFRELLPWLIVLLVLALVGGLIIMALRRWVRSPHATASEDFTLHDLRRMHAAGQLSDDEFQRAKAALIERVRGATSENAAETGSDNPQDQRDPRDATDS